MNLFDVTKTNIKRQYRRRVGRGESSGMGKMSGRGHKGYYARSGSGGMVLYEGGNTPLYRRLPKRGFRNTRFATEYAVVNVGQLEQFDANTAVTPKLLAEKGMIPTSCADCVKILGNGALTKKLTVTAATFSKSAVEKIEKAGGKATVGKTAGKAPAKEGKR